MTTCNETKIETLYSKKDLDLLDPKRIPHHVAIIMDGNRRWAKKQNFSASSGHYKGAETLIEIVNAAAQIGVKILTVYAFSTENWARPKEEIEDLFALFDLYLQSKKHVMLENGVKLSSIGDINKLSTSLQKTIDDVQDFTKGCEKIELILALNYGARNEICRAIKHICQDVMRGTIKIDALDESIVSMYLDTKMRKDPDLLIRTSGELRLSNFLLWQLSYTEVYVTDVLWPDFTKDELLQAFIEFQRRQRRLGGI